MNDREPTPPLSPQSALDWPGQAGAVNVVLAEINTAVCRRRRKRFRVAASALVALCVMSIAWRATVLRDRGAATPASAIVSMPARQILPDGTVVELKGNARVRVDFRDTERRVELVAGEAHFAVIKDSRRPFLVTAGNVEVRAVGTAFAVELTPSRVEVLVTEGRVAVERTASAAVAAGTARPSALVDAGYRATVEEKEATATASSANEPAAIINAVPAVEMAQRLGWRVPRLEFSSTRLVDALALFNRHSRVRLVLGEPSLGELRLSGVVRADNTGALLQLLQVDYGLVAEPGHAGEFVLGRHR